mmetsp:Transcript_91127/g.162213  ORF Transcript_91127/g.162213 Transcript_91127/m.162213 type:complete len:357 (+) Transcript_91127:110-1180(+)
MAAGTLKKKGKDSKRQVAQTADASAATSSARIQASKRHWVERPLEPVVANGKGMRVLGFVPLTGLKTTPLHAPVETAPSAAAGRRGGRGRGGRGSVEGPSMWKHGRPVYEHGNYGRYYGYRHGDGGGDRRLAAVAKQLGEDTFRDKQVLDIGCNAGLVSLEIAEAYCARHIVGMDIDANLVESAKGNLAAKPQSECEVEFRAEDILCSPLRRPPDDRPERFDVVLCLSVTKWVHYAHGDLGVQRLFKRCLKRVRPGGIFILEPQEWSSYKKKRHLTPQIRETVAGIELRPENFDEFLISIGFESLAVIEPPSDAPLNFQRSLRLFRRPLPEQDAVAEEVAVAEAEIPKKKRKKCSQ